MTNPFRAIIATTLLIAATPAAAQEETAGWIERSNEYTSELMEMQAQFAPESFAQLGLEQYDGLAMDLGPDLDTRYISAARQQIAEFRQALAQTNDPNLRQDLEILIHSLELDVESTRLGSELMLDWYDIPQVVFGNINGLLDDQVVPERRAKAVELLRRYTGLHEGSTPLTELAKARFEESRTPGKIGPYRGDVADALPKIPTYIQGIRDLFAKYDIAAPAALDAMERQFTEYGEWEEAHVLPAARDDFRLPPELYAHRLKTMGIDIDPETLIRRARRGFYEIRQQMDGLAPLVAAKMGFEKTDYPSVIAELQKTTVPKEELESFYAERLGNLEEVVRRENVVSLPDYPVLMRLASDAESAASPAPHMLMPRLIGNTGERGTFVLTTANPSAGEEEYNDFNFAAASWTLSVHEGRPGHELQFAQMVERGVSQARILYAFNSTNAEGWALYAEAEMQPYEPIEGQLIALQHRLLRASRAMLDPMLNLGQIDVESARRILAEEARFSPAMVQQELDRYTFRMPGQAGSYYYGYSQIIDLRIATELALGEKFDRQAFNDFLIGQGLLPIDLLAEAVRNDFIPSQMGKTS
ncbi:uncharacterized protein (DUF885 family) [Altererythrobacter atlanticus]|uniref:Uncharacterized protein n=1 Tax=Croceibacterium atlanticum TaxID=1267766 RepID=A0A0F7KNZ0_9SPHN|nr:DUF885 domain-containing protein [Croceibacterium atlanticum]AKH42223.1 hypothetical protein WYH_01177 [Croceibacterium atlanticum]MBB5733964.1 uncharacterized protein (DUF885 family) [Croceibacterium atlanticum]